MSGICSRALGVFFEYDTPKIVHINSKKVGVINRLIQLTILGYIIGYAIVWKKGYQEFDSVVSSATTKIKGTVYTNFSNLADKRLNHRIWDVADYVIPPQESNAFFVMTNVVETLGQTQGKCPEDPTMQDVLCDSAIDCPAGAEVISGNGVRTGYCVPSAHNASVKVCEIYAWCPVETDILPLGKHKALLSDSKRFTVMIKNNIEFAKFQVKRRNILDAQNSSYLRDCRYNSSHEYDRLCPIFALGVIVDEAKEDYDQMAVKGGVMSINIEWNCNLDFDISNCRPEYSFKRLDPREAKIAQGWNFRYANFYHTADGNQTRDLIKAYGIRYEIKVTGEAGKFNIVPLFTNIGSGIGLLAIATVLCDIVILYILRKGDFYKEKKYMYVTGDDAFQAIVSEDDDDQRQPIIPSHRQMNDDSQGSVGERNPGYQSFGEPPAQGERSDTGLTNRGSGATNIA